MFYDFNLFIVSFLSLTVQDINHNGYHTTMLIRHKQLPQRYIKYVNYCFLTLSIDLAHVVVHGCVMTQTLFSMMFSAMLRTVIMVFHQLGAALMTNIFNL